MRIQKLAVLVLMALPVAASAGTVVTAREMVNQWASQMHKAVRWEAGDALDGQLFVSKDDPEEESAESLMQRLGWLNRHIMEDAKGVPLFACVYNDVLVIRRIDQEVCGYPVGNQ